MECFSLFSMLVICGLLSTTVKDYRIGELW